MVWQSLRAWSEQMVETRNGGFHACHRSTERGKQVWSDPELGGCCQAEGGRRDKATS